MKKPNILTQSKKKQALALVKENRLTEAKSLYADICRLDPRDAEAWFRLGTINLDFNAAAQAESCFRRVVELEPRLAIAYYNLGRSLELQGKDDEAIATYRKLLHSTPMIEAYYNIGEIYAQQGKFEEALEIYRQALRIEPANPRLITAEASIYQKQGEYDRAYARLQPLLAAGCETVEIALVLASLSRHIKSLQPIAMMERLLARGDLSGNKEAQILLHFTLGKLLDAAGDYDRAFHHYRRGNEMRAYAFDPGAYAEYVDDIIRTFTPDFMQKAPHAKECPEHLIFIVGMPRSGTTLVEQILDSHPQVYGCGELPDMGNIVKSLPDTLRTQERYPRCAVSLTEESCNQFAQRYLERVRELSGNADFITDKMPQNFNFLGLIALLFPGAKVIHCTRDPLDTCLSCYFQDFRNAHLGLGFTADLANLGAYYKQYLRLMEHWTATLDIPMMEVSYESLIADQDNISRRLVEFCGLPWDERCLKFYDSGRAVTTASYDQVRQPLYRKSVQRWKHYEQYLEPLKKALQ